MLIHAQANPAAPSTARSDEIDGWRGFAIISVLLAHFIGGASFAWLGNFGVQLFFALSGLLMAELLFIRNVPLPTFFRRRLSRVVPTFFLYVLLVYVASIALGRDRPPLAELASTLLFLRTYWPPAPGIWDVDWPIGHLWTLNVEEHTYVFLGLLALLATGRKNKVAVIVLFLAAAVSMALNFYYEAFASPATGSHYSIYSQCAAYGILFAAALRVLRDRFAAVAVPGWVAPIFLAAAVVVHGGDRQRAAASARTVPVVPAHVDRPAPRPRLLFDLPVAAAVFRAAGERSDRGLAAVSRRNRRGFPVVLLL
jgi:peptidoglycan/LPS O-acetylase OafA/YrhL